ncbi:MULTISPECIES: AMP-dependent synthetase/ligase [Arthrobacter]|uniref:Acyl-CoA synthetase n=2 Tax=Arthrobacter TaxID=1663 RepID=A0ABU9KMM3_9MICC|nr:AMP-dependent synthetase/ligase [Arthrobacter sp. YJM1]MDP5227354.1 AMP-dependent synthetase/ligase [Arthrobacter sp. YJM1]
MTEFTTPLLSDLDPAWNVTDILLERVRATPDRPVYAVHDTARKSTAQNSGTARPAGELDGWSTLSAEEFLRRVRALSKGLIAGGLEPGDAVAVMSRTRFEWTLADFAIWHAGGVTVPIYETSSASQIEWILEDSGARRVFVEDAAKAELVTAVAEGSELLGSTPLQVIRMDDGGALPTLQSVANAGTGVSDAELERHRSAASLADTASIVYTSGTTGKPKGCEISHGNFALVAENIVPTLGEFTLAPGARTLMFLPLAHVLARAVQVICLHAGILVGHSSSAAELMTDMQTLKPTFLLAVPRIFEKVLAGAEQKAVSSGKGRLFQQAFSTAVDFARATQQREQGHGDGPGLALRLRHRVFDRLLYPRVRAAFGGRITHTVSGASVLNRHESEFFLGAGIPILEGYGLTETTAPAAVNLPARNRLGTVGLPIPGTSVRIAEDGEVLIKGIGVFKGYHNNPQADFDAFVDGWFATGDLGSLDADGYLTITGRKKDLIVTAGGKNVAPEPLEETIRQNPLVEHVVVIGEGRPFVSALIALDPEGVTAWGGQHGHPDLTPAQAAELPAVRESLQHSVDQANTQVSKAESIRKFAVLDAELSVDSGHLTPSLKLRRDAVVTDFSTEIERLYAK